jgi:hypothetical protein
MKLPKIKIFNQQKNIRKKNKMELIQKMNIFKWILVSFEYD